jgi:hypothetical protein
LVVLPQGAHLIRIRASEADRRQGAWKWCVADYQGVPVDVGGHGTMVSTLAAARLAAAANAAGQMCIDGETT